jgi:regulator of protease activity HflC (stomatin/prohibitin superfamily)
LPAGKREKHEELSVEALIVLAIVAIFVMLVLASAIKIVKEYERGVVFRLGRLIGPRGPGLILLIPFIERMVKVDLRTVTMDVPSQEVITRDNVTVRVNAVSYFRVMDPSAAVNNVTDYVRATSQIAQTTLRSVLGQSALDELLSEREQINQELQKIIDEQTEPWGIKVSIVEVKDVELPQSMQRAMARQAEAEREKRAKIIHAEGEFQASKQLANAAAVIAAEPVALQLRYLQTLTEIGAEKNTTVVFPLPIELISLLPIVSNGTPRDLAKIFQAESEPDLELPSTGEEAGESLPSSEEA